MIQLTTILSLALLSAASLASCDKKLESYLEIPSGTELESAHYQEILSALSDSALLGAKDLATELKKRAGESELFAELASLADNGAACSPALVSSFVDVFALINQSLVDDENRDFANKFSAYLKEAGRAKFAACAAKTADEFAQLEGQLEGPFEGAANEGECAKLRQQPLKNLLDVYNLARVLAKSGAAAPVPEVTAKFAQINEYNRACLQ